MKTKEERKSDALKAFRIFFAVSDAAFICVENVMKALGQNPTPSHMHILHSLAKNEIDKENPDMEKIDYLLKAMELEAEKNKNNKNS
jgi:hypothetical protein